MDQTPTADQDLVARNLAAVEAHFHGEATGEVERAIAVYTDDIVWEAPARGLHLSGKEAVATNYRRTFASVRIEGWRPLQRFATVDRVVDDSIVTFTLTGEGLLNAPLPVGTKVELRLVHIFEMRDGRISRETAFELWKVAP